MPNEKLTNRELAERIDRNTPELLKSQPQWVMWKYQHIPGKDKPKKPPFQINGKPAAVNDPASWSDYRQAMAVLETGSRYQGVGFMLDHGIVVIDLDDCLPVVDGVRRITKTAKRVYDLAHSYTEVSPSGKGLHIFLHGKMPEVNGQPQDGMKSATGEMYEAKRYITITGERVGEECEIREDQEAINQIYKILKPPEREPQRPQPEQRSYSLTSGDDQVITKASRAMNGAKFTRVYSGDISGYHSPSEAVCGLIAFLVYWTNKDVGQVDRIFKSSPLYLQNKDIQIEWDKKHSSDGKTYGQMTIDKALKTSRQL